MNKYKGIKAAAEKSTHGIQQLDEQLGRASLKERATMLDNLYIGMMRSEDVDSESYQELLILVEKWGKTTEQSFENHFEKLYLKKFGTIMDKMAEIVRKIDQQIEDTIFERNSVRLDQNHEA
ncbi:MAG: hypothetical protein ACRCZE_03710 [Candidatus Altimarinota bacterium]